MMISYSPIYPTFFPSCPSSTSFEGLQQEVEEIFEQKSLWSGKAAKLRGKFGWAAMSAYGRCGRVGMRALSERQYSTNTALTTRLAECLRHLLTLLVIVGPRSVRTVGRALPPIRLYTDASWHGELIQSHWQEWSETGLLSYGQFAASHPHSLQ